jgi:predicted HicB family RNase H-like nuclease
MSAMLEYKGYFGSVEFSDDDGVLHGRLELIRDLVTYEGRDAEGIRAAFQEAVDDYLELCEAEGRLGFASNAFTVRGIS